MCFQIKNFWKEYKYVAAFKMADTCAAEFEAATPYYYSVYGGENETAGTHDKKKVLVSGSGSIRIGQGIEFDYCSVHCTWAFSKEGYETIIVNNNPETVSTDFDVADKLYFEPLTPEDVQNIVDIEKPDGAVVQFGRQTAINLPKHKQMIITVKDADKPEAAAVAGRFEALGYKIYATRSTAKYLQEHGVNALRVNKIIQESPNVMDLILGHKIDLVIDTPTQGRDKSRDGFLIRRNAIETGVHCLTAMDTANALVTSLETANEELTLVDIATIKNI